MADLTVLACTRCGFQVDTWDEGNPYYVDAEGEKHHAYAPQPEKARCRDNDIPHLCLDCGEVFTLDNRHPVAFSPCCGSRRFLPTMAVYGFSCPKCHRGTLTIGERWWITGVVGREVERRPSCP